MKAHFDHACHVRLSAQLHAQIQAFAQQSSRSYSNAIRYLLAQALQKERQKVNDQKNPRGSR